MDVTDPALKTPQDMAEYQAVGCMLREMQPLLADAYGSPRLQALSAETDPALPGPDHSPYTAKLPAMDLEGFRISVSFRESGSSPANGACLCLQTGPDECYIAGKACGFTLDSLDKENPHLDLILAEEGSFADGQWIPGRRLNGDETARLSLEGPSVLHLKFFVYGDPSTADH